jgi:hypothetical protein
MAPIFKSNQAKTVGILGGIAVLLAIAASIKLQNVGMAFGALVLGGLLVLLYSFSTNCWIYSSGACSVWAWINVFLIGIILLGIIWGTLKFLFTPTTPAPSQPQAQVTLPSVSQFFAQQGVPAPTVANV